MTNIVMTSILRREISCKDIYGNENMRSNGGFKLLFTHLYPLLFVISRRLTNNLVLTQDTSLPIYILRIFSLLNLLTFEDSIV